MPQDWKDEARALYEERSRGKRFKLAEGENSIRVLPGMSEDGEFGGRPYEEYYAHPRVGPNQLFLACGRDAHGEGDCWLCDRLAKMRSKGSSAQRRAADEMTPVLQFVMQVAYAASDGTLRGPSLWTVPSGGPRSLATQILGVLMKTNRDHTSLKKGYNLNIERTGTGFRDTRYGAIVTDDESSAVPKKIVSAIKPLASLIPAYDADRMQAGFYGRDFDDSAPKSYKDDGVFEEEEDTSSSKKKKKKKEKKAAASAEALAAVEPSEDAPPPKKKKQSKKAAVPAIDSEVSPEFADLTSAPEKKKKKKKKKKV